MDIGTLTGTIAIEDQLSGALKSIGDKAVEFARGFDSSMRIVVDSLAIASAAVLGLAVSIEKLGEKGSTILGVEQAFDHLAEAAGTTGDALRTNLSQGVKATIDDFELMKETSKLLGSGIKLTTDQALLMGQAARELGKATGGDAASGLDIMSTALTTGRVRGLQQQIGLIDLAAGEKKFADSLGVTVDQLNEAGKLEGKRIAILDATQAYVDRLGISELSFKERIQQATVSVEEWGDKLATSIASSPHVMGALDSISEAIQKTFGGEGQTALETIIGFVNSFADTVARVAPTVISAFGNIAHAIGLVYDALVTVGTMAGGFLSDAFGHVKSILVEVADSGFGRLVTILAGFAWDVFVATIKDLWANVQFFGGIIIEAATAVAGPFVRAFGDALNIADKLAGTVANLLGLMDVWLHGPGAIPKVADAWGKVKDALPEQGFLSTAQAADLLNGRMTDQAAIGAQVGTVMNTAASALDKAAFTTDKLSETQKLLAKIEGESATDSMEWTKKIITFKGIALDQMHETEKVMDSVHKTEVGLAMDSMDWVRKLSDTRNTAELDYVRRQEKNIADTRRLWIEAYGIIEDESLTTTQKQIADVDRWYAEQVAKADEAGTRDQAYYDGLAALAEAKMQAVRLSHDNTFQAIKKMQEDLTEGWQQTFSDTLVNTGSFRDAFKGLWNTIKKDVESVFASLLTSIINGFLHPLLDAVSSVASGITNMLIRALTGGSGGGGGGGLLGGALGGLLGGGGGAAAGVMAGITTSEAAGAAGAAAAGLGVGVGGAGTGLAAGGTAAAGGGGILGGLGSVAGFLATNPIGWAIDAGIGALALWNHFSGPDDTELAGREVYNAYKSSVWDTLTPGQQSEAMSAGWPDPKDAGLLIGARDNYALMGRSDPEASAEAYIKNATDAIVKGRSGETAALQDIQSFEFGGTVAPFQSGAVPIIAHAGESVRSAAVTRSDAENLRRLADAQRMMAGVLASVQQLIADQPRAIGVAVSDAALLSPRRNVA